MSSRKTILYNFNLLSSPLHSRSSWLHFWLQWEQLRTRTAVAEIDNLLLKDKIRWYLRHLCRNQKPILVTLCNWMLCKQTTSCCRSATRRGGNEKEVTSEQELTGEQQLFSDSDLSLGGPPLLIYMQVAVSKPIKANLTTLYFTSHLWNVYDWKRKVQETLLYI